RAGQGGLSGSGPCKAGGAANHDSRAYSIRLNRHSRESGNPGQPTCRLPWTPAFAGVTGNVSTLPDQALELEVDKRLRCNRHQADDDCGDRTEPDPEERKTPAGRKLGVPSGPPHKMVGAYDGDDPHHE